MVISRNDELWAVEVKSEADSLSRLDGQVRAYLDCFDKVIVVSASKHVSHVLQMVPREVACLGSERLSDSCSPKRTQTYSKLYQISD